MQYDVAYEKRVWQERIASLKGEVSEKALEALIILSAEIGFEQGEIRPGELGQWDIYYMLEEWGYSSDLRRKLAGLPIEKVQAQQLDQMHEQFEGQMLASLPQDELQRLVDRLEKELDG